MTALLERDGLLAVLEELSLRSATSRGQIAVVSGEAGVGKSSLIDVFAQRLDATRLCARGHCDDLFAPRQLGPFFDLAPVLGADVTSMMTRGSAQGELFTALLAAIGRLHPGATLVFEDVHWADHSSIDALKFLARRLAPLRVLIVLTYRDDEINPEHPLTSLLGDLPSAITTRLRLEPLTHAAVLAIAERAGRDGDALYRATAGNPFFVSEVVAQPPQADDRIPGSVRDAVLARLSRIRPMERRFLEAISVAPDPVSGAAVDALLGPEGVAAGLACEARGMVVRDAKGRFRFRHELARVATLGALSPEVFRHHHRQLLDVYLKFGDGVPPDLIVHHAAALEDSPILLAHAPRAAARAASLGAHKDAAAFLAIALRHVDDADAELAARLYQDWAYEAGLFEVTDQVVDARREAVRRWRALGRPDRVGDNLRWLWRLHWYRGEVDLADAAAEESLAILESMPASTELAQAYALRSHLHLLKGRRSQSREWGLQAIDIARQVGDVDTRVQALITVATAMLFDGDRQGQALMDEGLELALATGLHEQAARAYTNYSEYAIVVGDWPRAERLVLEGLAFDIKHSLDSWTGYLTGRHAQLLLGQGRLAEAVTVARGALAIEGRTLLMRLPAMTSLAIARSRQAADDAEALLGEALDAALAMREQQRITPVRLGMIEHLFLRDRLEEARVHLQAMLSFGTDVLRPWDAATVCIWAARLGVHVAEDLCRGATAAQVLELRGDMAAAAALLEDSQAPFEAAMCRLAAALAGQTDALDAAHQGFEAMACQAGVKAVAQLALLRGRAEPVRRSRRGPYAAARGHPLGLTAKEVQVLALLVEGASNAEIAKRLSRSPRTVEHHVSSVLGKLNAGNRLEAILRAMAEPWIVQTRFKGED